LLAPVDELPVVAAPLLVELLLLWLVLPAAPVVRLPCANACCCTKLIVNTEATSTDAMTAAYNVVVCLLNIGQQTMFIGL